MDNRILALLTLLAGFSTATLQAADSRTVNFPDSQMSLTVGDDGTKVLTWPRLPSLETNALSAGSEVTGLSSVFPSLFGGDSASYSFTSSNALAHEFFSLRQTQMSSNALFAANVMNRITYGPTPDLQKRILTGPTPIGAQAYLDEQLNFNQLPPESFDTFQVTTTNAVTGDARLRTDWVKVTLEGSFSSSRLYVYLTSPGEAYIDNIQIFRGAESEDGVDYSTNYAQNGDFELPLTPPWNVSPNMAGSSITSDFAQSGGNSLHLVASSGGTTRTSSIWQDLSPEAPNDDATICFWYLPTSNSSIITVRLSGSGVRGSPFDETGLEPDWVYVTETGSATSDKIYFYLNGAGTAYIDDAKLVAGTVAEVGPNLLVNGDFETIGDTNWNGFGVASNSVITTRVAFEGARSLELNFTGGGTTEESAVVQYNLPLTIGQPYTLSYWYAPSSPNLTVRLSGRGIQSDPDTGIQSIYRRLETSPEDSSLADLRAWFIQHAVGAERQLLEVLTQFWENHFVTQHSKTYDYMDQFYDDNGLEDRIATGLEYREISRWRQAMLNPNVTFHDLLVIHAESPAQIIYLDTVTSRGDGDRIPNENYARELLELFCNGVDSGYDQADIVELSHFWTGWSVEIKEHEDIDDPFAPIATSRRAPGSSARENLDGTWTFNYREDRHSDRAKLLFPGKTVDARFGDAAPSRPAFAGRPYQLAVPARSGPDGINDGYDVLEHLAMIPHTMEYISVKLCRLFIHDDFVHGVYDYSDEETLSEEGKLIHRCMKAWDASGGRLRPVLDVIFESHLFRGQAAAGQKVKTPLEFCVSTIRALRSELPDGSFTGSTDGYSIAGTGRTGSRSHITRMGLMRLFDRGDPDGYPEDAPPWISAGTLAERVRYVQTVMMRDDDPDKDDDIDGNNNNRTDPVALIVNNLPVGARLDSAQVADYFTTLFFPGEGKANLGDYRAAANAYLNSDESGVFFSRFSQLTFGSDEYDIRVRGMVAALLSSNDSRNNNPVMKNKNINIISRRTFMNRSLQIGLAAAAATTLDIPGVVKRALAEGNIGLNGKKLLFIWLRGANDGLNSLVPVGDSEYGPGIRPDIGIPRDPGVNYAATGPCDFPISAASGDATYDYNMAIRTGNGFAALHPSLKFLAPVYNAGDLALIHRVGYPNQSRSHFDSQNYWENGLPRNDVVQDGILYRTMLESGLANTAPLTGVSVQSSLPMLLRGSAAAMTNLGDPTRYDLLGIPNSSAGNMKADNTLLGANGHPFPNKANRDLLRLQYQNMSNTLDVFANIDFTDSGNTFRDDDITDNDTEWAAGNGGEGYYLFPTNSEINGGWRRPGGGAQFNKYAVDTGGHGFFRDLKNAALILNHTDAIVAGTEFGGFDTHNNQGGVNGNHSNLQRRIGWAFYALRKYLTRYADKATWDNTIVVTLSEFGRTTVQNGNVGTDHAEAGVMWVAGGAVNGYNGAGRSGVIACHSADSVAPWIPGPANQGGGVDGTMFGISNRYVKRSVDYRSVLGELIRDHLGATQGQLDRIIPGYADEANEHLRLGGVSAYDDPGDEATIKGELGLV